MHKLLPLTEPTNPVSARVGESKQSRDSYVKLIPVPQAQIVEYALASGNKEFQTEYKMSSVSMWKANICVRVEALSKK